jgi:S-formylglutathione hydrolase FrmB
VRIGASYEIGNRMPVVVETFPSTVLAGNPLGDPSERRVPIYLPENYSTGSERYPVVYFLAGFGSGGTLLLNETLWGETLGQRLDRLIGSRAVRPMIVVMPDCITRLGGSQYIDSAATGRYEAHLVEELVPHVDRRYRTMADREHRVVMGKSSGGYAAIVLAMRHADVFGIAADHSGDKYFELCYKSDIPASVAALGRYDHSATRFLEQFPHPPEKRGRSWFTLVNMLAMASCYSPNRGSAVGFDLPFDERTAELRPDVWRRWLEHDPVEIVASHAGALRSLRLLYLDCGSFDEHHLQYGTRIFVDRLNALSIPHVYEEFDGGHMNVAHRYDVSLRTISEAFAD